MAGEEEPIPYVPTKHRPRPVTREHRKITATVTGHAQVEMLEAMSFVAGRQPYQLVNDLVLDAIREAQADPEMVRLTRVVRRARLGLRVVS